MNMERKNIVQRLVKEGMSEKTLANFSDKQLSLLANRMLGEQKGSVVMSKARTTPPEIKKMTDSGVNVELREKLTGGQKKLDINKNGKLDSGDFKMLRNKKQEVTEKTKPSAGLSKEKKSEVAKAAKAGKDIGKKGKGFKEVEKKAKESGAKNPKAVAAAAMWKNIKRESIETENWVNGLVETEYHPFTSKAEIMELIEYKMGPGPGIAEPEVVPDVEPDVEPDTTPYEPEEDEPFYDPWKTPGTNPDKRPKFQDNSSMPEFMKFKNLVRKFNEIK